MAQDHAPRPQRGQDIKQWATAMAAFADRTRPRFGDGFEVAAGPAGISVALGLADFACGFGKVGAAAIPKKSGTTVSGGDMAIHDVLFSVGSTTGTDTAGDTVTAYLYWGDSDAPANRDCFWVRLAGTYYVLVWACA